MNSESAPLKLELQPDNPLRLANLCGRLNEHLRLLEDRLDLRINSRGNVFYLNGSRLAQERGSQVLKDLYEQTAGDTTLTPDLVHLAVAEATARSAKPTDKAGKTDQDAEADWLVMRTPKLSVRPRSPHQNQYLRAIARHDINFG